MMSANLRELLTAAIDGELSPAERKTAQTVLHESEAARILFAQLKADAARIKKLPRVAAPAELSDNILNAIRERAMTPTPLPPSRRAGRKFNWSAMPIWMNLVTAASVLLVISMGSYLYFSASHDYFAGQNNAAKDVAKTSTDVNGGAKPPADKPKDPTPEIRPAPEMIVERPREVGPEMGPSPREVRSDAITSDIKDPLPEIEPFDVNKIRISQLFTLSELSTDESARAKLVREMKKDELIRLDLFCQTTPKAMEAVVNALKSRGITAITDSFVNDRIKRKAPTEVMIFTEALTLDEVAQLLSALGAEDAKSGAREFSKLVAAPFLPSDLERLGRSLGVPNVLPKPVGKVGVDIRKPLPQGTADHVAATLSKMGTTGTSPKPEKVAVVVAFSPMNGNPAASKEIKQFLDRRGERAATAKPLMLVLRTSK